MSTDNKELRELKTIFTGGGGVATIRESIRMSSLEKYVHTPSHVDDELIQIVEGLIEQAVIQARVDPFDFVGPCEENCTKERHAYHQGQWDMATRMQASLSQSKQGGEGE